MKLYRFSPIMSKDALLEAIKHIHFECHMLCKQTFGKYLANAGNMGVFCHYPKEYEFLVKLREQLTEPSDNPDQKYFKLHEPITIPAKDDVPETTYTHLYIRKPDPYRHHVGDLDFYLEPSEYTQLKNSMLRGAALAGARMFDRKDLDMIELYDPDVDVLAYVSTKQMTQDVRKKVTEAEDNEIIISRVINAPREKVWEAFTDPEKLNKWWGPDGFSLTTHDFSFKKGGEWNFVMHGPDGRDYPNKVVFTEIVKPRLMRHEHSGDSVHFLAEITLEAQAAKTIVTLRTTFPTKAERDANVLEHNAVEGGKQTLARLAEYVE